METTTNALSGAIAGLLSRLLIAPLDILKIRMQLNISSRPSYSSPSTSYSFLANHILRNEGLKTFWKVTTNHTPNREMLLQQSYTSHMALSSSPLSII